MSSSAASTLVDIGMSMSRREKKPLVPLSPSALNLLPPAGASLKCSVFTSALGVNPAGSGVSAAMVILVDTPLPWPKPVFDHPLLAGLSGKARDSDDNAVRIFAAVPAQENDLGVTAFEPTGAGTVGTRIALGDRSVHTVVEEILSAGTAIGRGVAIGSRAMMVCTQGTHDVCCGTEGTALVLALADDDRFDGIPIFKVSHTGGHRFAPTAMTFPDGRMWAFVGIEQLATAMFRTDTPSAVAPWCRGSWAAPTPRQQAAECAVFARSPWSDEVPTFKDESDDVVVVYRAGEVHRVRVTVSREIPIIRCRADGGLPAKPSLEYRTEVL